MTTGTVDFMINETVAEVYSACSIQTFPIDCFSILTQYHFRILSYSTLKKQNPRLFELSSQYSSDAFKYEDIIAYNEKMNAGRIRFSLMHELGHHLLGHQFECRRYEDQADSFASSLLAPRVMMHKLETTDAEKVHRTFGLSYQASNLALADYKNWLCRTTIRGSLTKPEEKLKDLFFPGGKKTAAAAGPVSENQLNKRSKSDNPRLEESLYWGNVIHAVHGDAFYLGY